MKVEEFTARDHPDLPPRIKDTNQRCPYCGKPMTHVMDADREFYGFEEIYLCETKRCPEVGNWHLPVFSYAWELGIQALSRFAEREGHTVAPKKHKEKALLVSGAWRDVILATWIEAQRGREKNGDLTSPERVRLESLPGWSWQPQTAAQP